MKNHARSVTTAVAVVILAPMPLESALAAEDQVKEETKISPLVVKLPEKGRFASFTNRQHPGNKIGYRFFEHSPLVLGAIPQTVEETGIVEQKVRKSVEEFSSRRSVVIYKHRIRGKREWVDQTWTFHMAPAEDGIEMLWVIQTEGSGLPRYYGVQQCFRMSGRSNSDWRREIAETPAFSEYDLWKSQEHETQKTSLTWVLRSGQWQSLPAIEGCVGARTPFGMKIDKERFQGNLPGLIGPYKGAAQDPVDCGLITRTNVAGTWVCGIYWEGTSHVTDHHPADCLHAIVNIGNIPPHCRRAVRGKIYWFKGSKDDLLKKWRKDFPKSRKEQSQSQAAATMGKWG